MTGKITEITNFDFLNELGDLKNLGNKRKDEDALTEKELQEMIPEETKIKLAELKWKYYNGCMSDLLNPTFDGSDEHIRKCAEFQKRLDESNKHTRSLPDDLLEQYLLTEDDRDD